MRARQEIVEVLPTTCMFRPLCDTTLLDRTRLRSWSLRGMGHEPDLGSPPCRFAGRLGKLNFPLRPGARYRAVTTTDERCARFAGGRDILDYTHAVAQGRAN